MRHILSMLLFVLVTQVAYAQDQLFKKYENVNGVETVFISKSLLSLAGNSKIGNMELRKAAGKLEQIRILSTSKSALIKTISNEANAIFKRDKYEEIMRMSEDGEKTVIYRKQRKAKNEFVLVSTEKNELSIINLIGNFTMEELKEIAD